MGTDAKWLLRKFGLHYKARIGEIYPPAWGRDMKIFTDLLNLYSVEKLESLLELYFEQEHRIYSIPFFKVALGELLQIQKEEQENRPKVMPKNEDWRFE